MNKKTEKGQSMVELMLVLPFLLAMFALVIDAALIMWVRVSVQNAASEGGRAAQVWNQDIGGVSCEEYVTQAAYRVAHAWSPTVTAEASDPNDPDPCTTDPSDRIAPGELIRVHVVTQHTPLLSHLFFTSDPLWFPLPAEVVVRHE